ncbi:hypothetical protein BJ085DRAFT_43634 [Dimargaris cristalligena]|uniref:NFACT RNA-binding domain-containing protein n=1 Tax=Dimargaris cristalligena TaxID=215637 RepID=A0A4V1J4S4_9FUNG|nr:hypothetical protein BJ085DRAFT_43634 [Dimargaris cristalligena]|eukprot:RKP36569.1 hypothetical protein BJ085DRAFT_43634 [Dimargaris cristalligena]
MVYYFESTAVSPKAQIYVGKDKVENEELIKHGWDEDVWFHVDKLSSAHIYLRMTPGQTWDNLPQALLIDLGQLTKANSIEGNKNDDITIIYTPWSNLKKTGDMAVGQVSFRKHHLVKRVHIETRSNEIVNRLNKTKTERFPDFYAEKTIHLKALNKIRNDARLAKNKEEERQKQAYKKLKEMKNYHGMFDEAETRANSNQNCTEDLEDDFM